MPQHRGTQGQFSTGLDVGTGLPISFTIDSMRGYLRCTNGTVDGSTPSEDQVPPGTQCTGILTIASAWPAVNGEFCSRSCTSGNPASVLAGTRPAIS